MKAEAFALLTLLISSSATGAEPDCASPLGAAVPDLATAKAVAAAIISARQKPVVSAKYRLRVEIDAEQPGGWIAYQTLPQRRSSNARGIIVQYGGGGIAMRIDRCTGEITNMHYSR